MGNWRGNGGKWMIGGVELNEEGRRAENAWGKKRNERHWRGKDEIILVGSDEDGREGTGERRKRRIS